MHQFAKVCQAKKEKVHVAEEAVAEEYGYESEQSLLKIEEITAIKGSGKQLTASITFLIEEMYKEQLVCQLDTGATCNVISHRNLVQLLQNGDPPLLKSNAQLKLFDGTLMQPVGEIMLTAERKGKLLHLKFQVVESSNKPLPLAEACEQLGLLKVDIDPEESINVLKSGNLTRDQILSNYKDVFEGLGHIGDTTIITDPSVKPVQHAPRRVPVALRGRVKAKLDDLERKGIVEKVAIPTDWISSMVVVTTPNKIRICLDPKDLNTGVIRPKTSYCPSSAEQKYSVPSMLTTGSTKLVWMKTAASRPRSGPLLVVTSIEGYLLVSTWPPKNLNAHCTRNSMVFLVSQ